MKATVKIVQVALTPDVVQPGSAEQLFLVPGVKLGDFVGVNKPTPQSGLGIGGARASANGQIGLTFTNDSGGPILPIQEEFYTVMIASGSHCDDRGECDWK